MGLEINKVYHGFKLVEETSIDEIKSTGRIYEHVKSGARLLHLENNDDNKVFSIAFRTTPKDSTGVPHIMEHSVLGGSRKFKTKDPFADMSKSSLQTFLDAITYPDKTVYPISSRNQKDFMNLMDVYLDAVFYPNIYDNHGVLRQEGWRYEIDPQDGKLKYKGVVYSEMQGAKSFPEWVLAEERRVSLFPHTTYANISGGDPEVIPDLTQEEFENFHRKYYHPANSYIFLYGDQDIDKCLEFIDKEYLSNFERVDPHTQIEEEKQFESMREITSDYSISEDENEKNKTYLSLNFACCRRNNGQDYLAFKILVDMLINSSSSPLRKVLMQSDIGETMLSYDEFCIDVAYQNIFSIVLKNSEASKKDEFKNIIFDTLQKLVKDGIDRNIVEASINKIEFELREADAWGIGNKGIMYNENVLESWIYDGHPLTHIMYEKNLNKIKESVDERYFESLIEKYLLKNNHCSLLILKPVKGLDLSKAEKLDKKLQEYKKTLSSEEIKKLKEKNQKLKDKQFTPDSIEAKNTIPQLSLSEISKEVQVPPQTVVNKKGVTILCNEVDTNKICYINLLFDAGVIEEKYVPYLALLEEMLGQIDTKKSKYSELNTKIFKNTGGITFDTEVFGEKDNTEKIHPKFILKSKVLCDNMEKLYTIISEIITCTEFEDENRIKEIINKTKSKIQIFIGSHGDILATNRALSYFSLGNKYNEKLKYIDYYKFICDIEKNFDTMSSEIQNNLKNVCETIFNKNNLIISYTGEKEYFDNAVSKIDTILNELSDEKLEKHHISFKKQKNNEGLLIASNVQYAAKAFNLKEVDLKYNGSMKVLQNIITSDYLYTRVRLQGGAYGCYMLIRRNGNIILCSYSDPNLSETFETYDKAYKFIQENDISDKDMVNFIIGAIGVLDRPVPLYMKGEIAVQNYISGVTKEDLQNERTELLNTTIEDIKVYSDMIHKGMQMNYLCAAGNEKKIKDNKDLFGGLVSLI